MAEEYNLEWNGDLTREEIERILSMNLTAAAIVLTNDIVASFGNVSTQETNADKAVRMSRGRNSAATKEERHRQRSLPWGPPNVDTGHLKRNVTYDTPTNDPWIRRVGTGIGNAQSVGYGMYLEFGTVKMLPRPFMRPALYRNRQRIRELIARRVTK